MKSGDIAIEKNTSFKGVILEVYDSWQDLKAKNNFATLSNPDSWLALQEYPYTATNLKEKWVSISYFEGGAGWTCQSRIDVIPKTNN